MPEPHQGTRRPPGATPPPGPAASEVVRLRDVVVDTARELVQGWHSHDSPDSPPCSQPLCQAIRALETGPVG